MLTRRILDRLKSAKFKEIMQSITCKQQQKKLKIACTYFIVCPFLWSSIELIQQTVDFWPKSQTSQTILLLGFSKPQIQDKDFVYFCGLFRKLEFLVTDLSKIVNILFSKAIVELIFFRNNLWLNMFLILKKGFKLLPILKQVVFKTQT